ncbi:MAG: 4Fe-4S cluster-binding domain-containing protein [Candidatus Hadarchaeales archaeon]
MRRNNMRKMVRTTGGALLVGKMPRGCELCVKGAKMVLFVTGLCRKKCYYCPLSERRRGKDIVYANERPVRTVKEILDEARLMDALGTGITGGDPVLRMKKTVNFIRAIKRRFGTKHHIHMYCGSEPSRVQLIELKNAGLDEIRFHTWSEGPVRAAVSVGLNAGVEIPAIPGHEDRIKELIKRLETVGCSFLNLNELEFSDTNLESLRGMGFRLKSDESMAVKGSEMTAKKVLRWAESGTVISVYYCPSSLKDSVQLRNRLKRRARNVMKRHEVMTGEGLIFKGIVADTAGENVLTVRKEIMRRYDIPPELIFLDRQKGRVELHWAVAKKIAPLEKKFRFALIEEYPTWDRLETTFLPL